MQQKHRKTRGRDDGFPSRESWDEEVGTYASAFFLMARVVLESEVNLSSSVARHRRRSKTFVPIHVRPRINVMSAAL